MNEIYLRDCIICGKYFAISTVQRNKNPTISQRVPVIPRKKSFKTCSSDCSKKFKDEYYKLRNNDNTHKIDILINHRILRSRDKFKKFCIDYGIAYSGNI